MTDYESLVIQLRSLASEGGLTSDLIGEAATAIESLLAEIDGLESSYEDTLQYYRGVD